MPYDIDAIRKNIKKAVSGKFTDPDEFKPEKAKEGTEIKYRFFVLPPIKQGDVLKSGTATRSMDNFFLTHGNHWINDRPHACPRIWDGSDCEICQYGFDLYKECKEKKLGEERKKEIGKQWMPNTNYMVNIFFTQWKGNPEDLRGKVKFYNAPKTCLDKWMATLMKDDKGDAEDPEAYGVFFDENSAFCFELVVTKDGRTNGYKTSGFIKNNGTPVPMIMNEDRTPNKKKIEQLLQLRIDLFTKVETPDPGKIARLANTMISGDDDDAEVGGGFDADETEPEAPAATTQAAPAKKVEKPAGKPAAAATQKSSKPVQSRTETKKTTEQPAPSPGDDDDDIASQMGDAFGDEAQLDSSSEDSTPANNDDDIGGEDIDALLNQLDD